MGKVIALSEKKSQKNTNKTGESSASLDILYSMVSDDLKSVNQVIIEHMDSPVSLISQLAGHIIASGGKRLRPMLTLATAKMCGYTGKRHIELAVCIEFIHTASLLHHDVVD